MDLKTILSVFKSRGLRYLVFRTTYEFRKRTGLLRLSFPSSVGDNKILSLEDFRNEDSFFFTSRENLSLPKQISDALKEKANRIISGEVLFFSSTWYNLGLDYDWITNPVTGYRYDIHQHWTRINEFSKDAGDIKFVWEKSRFSWLLTICRYDYHFDKDHSEFVIRQILDWIDKNPLNCGPNYICSQECSIRILNWLFALNFYRKSNSLTEERWQKIINSIYRQTDHVMKNINFSRIAVRNNHAITETLTLYLMGLMFPKMKGASLWKKKGKKWFEQEIDYQIEDDGTFIQDSMNYHRVVIQLLTYAIAISDKQGDSFSGFVYEKAYKSLNFLYQCQELSNGWLPNYGNNDGALFFPLSDADYRDYRSQLDALHGLLTGKPLYEEYLEDSFWIGHKVPTFRKAFAKIERRYGAIGFEKSGYFLVRERDCFTFIRCGLFKANGSTDQLHIDAWYKGINILMDAGSYMYNTDEKTVKYFAGTESHNTIMIGDYDQMQKGKRFMWFNPPTIESASLKEQYFDFLFEGRIKAYKQLADGGITITRRLIKEKGRTEWRIVDTIEGAPDNVVRRQLWHTDKDLHVESNGEVKLCDGWTSDYYGVKRKVKQIDVQSNGNRIETVISIEQ